ncbi:hypothetical protein [Marinobacter sp. JSM 1782161]|uniref:hypothetical protein n=1 Tax=Marinobacter sp. JSM 1782161 TaxID=2685906 RepID=UPI001403ECA3|nr:hypothetical protein [Marinobacter sp. JSM 1782161]
MKTIYVLKESLPDWGQYELIGWSDDEEWLEREAERLEWKHYHAKRKSQNNAIIYSPDQTGFRRYVVEPLQKL